jgi:single-strand DNA-binding protein|tara:strand:+ start:1639 stop:2142 length:504 start_codon:yes stop_codon:yes gene_type:complete
MKGRYTGSATQLIATITTLLPAPCSKGFNKHGEYNMSNHFIGEGNLGSTPEYREFPNGNDEPRRLLRLNVYFDNPVPTKEGFEDRGGFWAPVELWHRDAEHWKDLYQKGMRVLVQGRTTRDEWEDAEEQERVTFKVEARRVGILPFRVASVMLVPKPVADGEKAAGE